VCFSNSGARDDSVNGDSTMVVIEQKEKEIVINKNYREGCVDVADIDIDGLEIDVFAQMSIHNPKKG
jgi:hypothetical protein